eukprot:CAMPEP_0119061650 /NCGR_PEP_ID=MMETSP1178-20130426/5424_1 /TAXON_ID=33656 /ORGANISM="unid sp, Strain CCMP2000" /LENGTH=283 /DNA_ID=CAMNT_0007042879 /DNA_START=57 /DNA_END=908 /DNA_ORIENTATION=-
MSLLLSCATASAYVALGPERLAARATPVVSLTPRHTAPQLSLDLGASYVSALHEHYYATASLQAFPLVCVGDLIAQLIERRKADDLEEQQRLDLARTLQMGMLGTLIGGLGTATWLRWLEGHVHTISDLPVWLYEPVLRALETYAPEHGVGLDSVTDDLLVLVKAVLDSCVWAPIENTLFLILTPLIEGASFDEVGGLVNENFFAVMQTELGAFFPYNLVAFSLVPPLLRPFSTGLASMCFSVYISLTTHTEPPAPHLSVVAETGPGPVSVECSETSDRFRST